MKFLEMLQRLGLPGSRRKRRPPADFGVGNEVAKGDDPLAVAQTPYVTILFVCTANVCRSAIAEALLKKNMASELASNEIGIESAGTEALVNLGPDAVTSAVCGERGVEVKSHRSRQVRAEIIHEASFIVCMAENHKKIIVGATPEAKEKTFLLKEFLHPRPPKVLSVSDPTGQSKKAYESCFEEIANEIERMVPQLQKRIARLKKELELKDAPSQQPTLW